MVKTKTTNKVRLPVYLQIVKIAAFLIILFFLFLVWRFPKQFDFIVEPRLFMILFTSFAVINPIFSYFVPRLVKSKRFYSAYLYNILWAVFMIILLYTLGGVRSYFGILLVFPIVTTAFNLEANVAIILGVISEFLFLILMFADSRYDHTGGYYVAGFSFMLLLALFTYYLYSLIKEGVRHKFEKEEAKKKYFDLAEVDRAKTEFITVVSHQLRTPLAELRWAIGSILEEKKLDHGIKNLIQKSRQSVDKLVEIVNSLLQISELQKPKLEYKNLPVDLGRLVDSIIASLQNLTLRKAAAVNFQSQGTFTVNGDAERLRIALANVIENAVKYSPGGRVKISLAREQRGVKITISDNGIGIPAQEKAQIFTKFFRASNALKVDTDETGVGLFIAKHIIEKHHGAIDFVSEVGRGTTFTILLPAAVV